jgi:hypothetical protein
MVSWWPTNPCFYDQHQIYQKLIQHFAKTSELTYFTVQSLWMRKAFTIQRKLHSASSWLAAALHLVPLKAQYGN